jgi:V8-like Glu-specific endopeptidase
MITQEILNSVRNAVCAVGCLVVPLTEYVQQLDSPDFKVVGTGFLVRPTTVLTNKHVLTALLALQADLGIPDSQLFLSFVVPSSEGKLRIIPRMIRRVGPLPAVDIAFLEFQLQPAQHFENVIALEVANQWGVLVSEDVCIFGYPYGNAILEKDGKVARWGPVLQQGHVSAISPFDTVNPPDEILLDVRTAPGMSGAPVFRPSTGIVIAVHYQGLSESGGKATTAFAIPMTAHTLASWLSEYASVATDLKNH